MLNSLKLGKTWSVKIFSKCVSFKAYGNCKILHFSVGSGGLVLCDGCVITAE